MVPALASLPAHPGLPGLVAGPRFPDQPCPWGQYSRQPGPQTPSTCPASRQASTSRGGPGPRPGQSVLPARPCWSQQSADAPRVSSAPPRFLAHPSPDIIPKHMPWSPPLQKGIPRPECSLPRHSTPVLQLAWPPRFRRYSAVVRRTKPVRLMLCVGPGSSQPVDPYPTVRLPSGFGPPTHTWVAVLLSWSCVCGPATCKPSPSKTVLSPASWQDIAQEFAARKSMPWFKAVGGQFPVDAVTVLWWLDNRVDSPKDRHAFLIGWTGVGQTTSRTKKGLRPFDLNP